MKQTEKKFAAIGSGAGIISECSSDASAKYPHLTILIPGEDGVVINGGHTDQATHDYPAKSLELRGPHVAELYQLLKEYFEA